MGGALTVRPVAYRGEVIGRLQVGRRGRPVQDDAVVADLVRLLGLALSAALTGAALRDSRERIVRPARRSAAGCAATCTTGWGRPWAR